MKSENSVTLSSKVDFREPAMKALWDMRHKTLCPEIALLNDLTLDINVVLDKLLARYDN